jgi:hypothetical protein
MSAAVIFFSRARALFHSSWPLHDAFLVRRSTGTASPSGVSPPRRC